MAFKYHFQAKKGWINDPKGLSFYNGKIHAFFQYNPYSTKWDKMHWGHATSSDFISWEEQDIALYPDKSYENSGGCFSGSALIVGDKQYLYYTAVSHERGQVQCLAVENNGKFCKFEGNPILYSPIKTIKEFRDPKVFSYKGKNYMVCGGQDGDRGVILLFSAKNVTHWKYEGIIYSSNAFGMLECPDLFKIGNTWVLTFSATKPTNEKQVFLTGKFDGKTFTVKSTQYPIVGKDFYAGQTFLYNKDRVIMGWLYHHGRELEEGEVSAGALSIPCNVKLVMGRLKVYPVDNAKKLLSCDCKHAKVVNRDLQIFNQDKIIASYDLEKIGVKKIRKIEYLLDGNVLEIFINGGTFYIAQWLI